MNMTDLFAAQLDREAAISRRILPRVPEDRPDWKPHPRSMPLGYLASLVATMPSWVAMAIEKDELDLAPAGGQDRPPLPGTAAELLAALERDVASGQRALAGTSDAHLLTPWRLLVSGRVVMELARHVVIEDTFTHMAHHRGQLSVYLRLNGVALPSLYGPTADEPAF
jgi:uncharacterized damage-inducible protein DinB